MPNIANLQKLVDALRSDDYRKGSGRLRGNDDSYCCLGVATELSRLETGIGQWIVPPNTINNCYAGYTFQTPDGRETSSYLALSVQEWLGVNKADIEWGVPNPNLDAYSLSILNDRTDSFEPIIAKLLELFPELK